MHTDKVPVSCYITGCTEPYRNLAVERYLLEHTPAGSVTLYLWQNKKYGGHRAQPKSMG